MIVFCWNVSVATRRNQRMFVVSAARLNWRGRAQGSVCTLDTERLSGVTLHLYNNASIHLAFVKHSISIGPPAESCNFPGSATKAPIRL